MTDWQIKRETVYRLYMDGKPITDADGRPQDYASEEEAQHVAANWDLYRAPTLVELRALSDTELDQKIEEESQRGWGWYR